MLGRLKMSITECIDEYLSISRRVFRKKKHRLTLKGNLQGRFDSEELKRAVKEVVVKQGLPEDALLKDAPDAGCKVYVLQIAYSKYMLISILAVLYAP
jgi:hypothetical protein